MEHRSFLKSVTAVSAVTILKPGTVFGTNANSSIRMGIIGCGGRGTLTTILGRTAATAGEEITWDEMIFSNERLDPMLNLTQFDKQTEVR